MLDHVFRFGHMFFSEACTHIDLNDFPRESLMARSR